MEYGIIRQIKIDLITGDYNSTIEWFTNIWQNIEIHERNVLHLNGGEYIYYTKVKGKYDNIFFRDDNRRIFWCDYDNFWQKLESHIMRRVDYSVFYLDYQVCQIIIKILVEYFIQNTTNNLIANPEYRNIGGILIN